jgi:hypothetical protein
MSLDMRSPISHKEPEHESFLDRFRHEPEPAEQPEEDEYEEDEYAYSDRNDIILWWETLKHLPPILESKVARTWIIFLFIAIVAYSLYTNSPLMAITFILIGMVGYLLFNRPGEIVLFSISGRGIAAGPEFYEYDTISSFWIIQDHPQFPNHLIIQTGGILSPRVHIPLEENHPEEIRDILLDFIPEIKYEPNMVDTIERMFHI